MSLRKLLLTLLVAVVTWLLVAPAGPSGAGL